VKTITSRQNPIVRAFRELASTPEPEGTRLLLDGIHLVRDAVAAGSILESVAVSGSKFKVSTEEAALARTLDREGVDVFAVSESVLRALSPSRSPASIVAIARRAPVAPSSVCGRSNALILAACDVQDPGNLGSLLRSAEAAGATGALVGGASANPFSWKAIRGSMGSALRLPVAWGLSADEVLGCLRQHGVRIVAGTPRGGVHPDAIDWTRPVGLLLGGEGAGLSDDALAQCDVRVTIPMVAPVESLNVAVAGAILLYATRCQRS